MMREIKNPVNLFPTKENLHVLHKMEDEYSTFEKEQEKKETVKKITLK